ncbi:immunoglobulin-like domain-containing protein [Brevibacillus panacihumi]|uniref:immunoglobulin-like domain-containing protein n=1 Tax=Brevibacillus panacihumi TaxID=497735 RepID=UPI000685693F|nr:immunoglobulin-like domain-containing protein [Brevibacillus panacihumi]
MNQRTNWIRMLVLALLLGLVQVLPITGARAAGDGETIYYVKMQGNDESSGTTWDDAFATLQKALESAQSGDQIWIAEGTYYPTKESFASDARTKTFQMKNGVEIYGGYSGMGTERHVTDYETILSGDIGVVGDQSDNAYHVFHNRNVDQTAKLDGVTITGGYASGYYVYDQDGGGMYNYQSSPTLRDITFIGNTAIKNGGGIANSNNSNPELIRGRIEDNKAPTGGGMSNSENSNPTLYHTKISKNKAEYNGGGIYNYKSNPALTDMEISENEGGVFGGGLYGFESNPILTRVEIRKNRTERSGGGVHITQGSHAVFTDVKIIENESVTGSGGGISNDRSNPSLTNVEINRNKAGSDGGGVYYFSEGGVFTNVTIRENTATGNGGGGYSSTNSKATLTNVEIINNQAKNGGGTYHYYSNDVMTNVKINENQAIIDGGGIFNYGASPRISGAEVKGNSAGNSGGGIYSNGAKNVLTNAEISGNRANMSGGGLYNIGGKPALTNVTISGNEADVSGGGIFIRNSDSGTIRNSIVWGNAKEAIYYYSGSIQLSHSLVDTDPKFIDFAQGNYRLSADSPAIDQGSTQYYDAGLTPDLSSITTDMDGNPRSVGNSIDMGAYEYLDNEARLDNLLVKEGNRALMLAPEFSSTVTSYRLFVNLGVTQIKLTPTLKDPLAEGEMRINGGAWSPIVNGAEQELQLGNGENEVQIQVTAKDGTVKKTYTVKIDSLPKPELTVSHSDWTNQDVTITATNREEGAKLEYSTDGQNWLPNSDAANPNSIVVTNEGSYSVYVRQADASQTISEIAEAEVRIDKTAPMITLNGDAVLSIHRGSTFSDPGAQVADNLDPNPQISVTGMVDTNRLGENTLTYKAADHVGNQAVPVIRTVKVVREDALLGPTISLTPSGWTREDVEVSISGEAGALLEYSLDGQQWVAYVGPFTIQDENQTKLYARQTDALQNVSDVAEVEVRIDKTAPVITLNGAATMSIYRGSVFQDPGVTITDNIATGLTPVVTGTVDTNRLGEYTLTYEAVDHAGNQAVPVIRTVKVVREDALLKPTILLDPSGWTKGDVEVTVSGESGTKLEYSLDGQQWVAYVGPFTIQDENQTKLYARQTDALQNVSDVAEVEVRIDKTAPVITLNGAATMSIYRGSVFQDPGVRITDNIATGLTPVVTGTVDTNKLGTYTLQYDAADWAGNQAAPVTRTIRVISRPVTPPPPVEVPVPVTKVTLTPQTLTLTVGEESATLQATITPSNATNRAVSWSSSNPSVAAVDATGKVTAKQAGQATITVTTADGNKTASSEVTVVEEGNEKLQLEVSLSDIHLKPGASKSFKVYAVEGEERTEITKNKDIIYDIDNDLISVKRGRITAGKKAGKAQITIRYQGEVATITVTVKKEEADRLTLRASESLLLIEPDLTVSFRVYAVGPNTLENITHDKNTTYSIDSDLAKVTAGRVKTGKEEGETELTIHYLGEELTIPVVISKISVKALTASTQKLLLGLDEEETLRIRARLSNKREKDVTELVDWSSSTPGIVEVAEDGTIIPLKKGTAVLTARYGGRNVNISVRVVDEKELQELHATYSSLSLEEGETASLAITAIYERNHKEDVTEEVEWSVDDPEIATVENGVITGISEGVTTITATYAGKEAEIFIKVWK